MALPFLCLRRRPSQRRRRNLPIQPSFLLSLPLHRFLIAKQRFLLAISRLWTALRLLFRRNCLSFLITGNPLFRLPLHGNAAMTMRIRISISMNLLPYGIPRHILWLLLLNRLRMFLASQSMYRRKPLPYACSMRKKPCPA